MRKWKLLSVTALTLLLLTGCQNPNASAASTENADNHKEQQVTSLTKQDETAVDLSDFSEEYSDEISEETNDSGEFYGDTLESLEEAVNDIVLKIDDVSVSGTADEKREAFFKLNNELQEVDNQLDYYDENTENDFEQGRLSYDEARELEYKIEQLEDLLDRAEDTLEYKFGYDD